MPTRPPERDYSATPLAKKLGLLTTAKDPETSREIALLAAPEGFVDQLKDLPENLRFTKRLSPRTELALCFVRSARELGSTADLLAAQLPPSAHVWIIHPKAHHKPDFNQNHVRDAGLARNLVDYKVCSIDDDWSALKFAWRKT